MTTLFRGLSAFPLTPADADGIVDADRYAAMIARLVEAGVDSIGALGSTGAAPYLDAAQRARAVRVAVEGAGGRVKVIAGVSALRTSWARDLARDAAAAGADGLLLAPVSYQPLNDEEVFRHFEAVAGATDLPLCIYNNPRTTQFAFSDALVGRLATVANIAAVKMPLPADRDFRGEIGRLRRDGFSVGYSADWGMGAAMLGGADAFYSVAAGLLPAPCLRLVRAAQAGDAARAGEIEASLAPLWALFQRVGSFRVMYAMADRLGLPAGAPPLPVQPVPHAVIDEIATILAELAD